MANYRESLPRTLDSGLAEGIGECPIDRLLAFSLSPRLGTLYWRLCYKRDSTVLPDLILALIDEANVARHWVELALHEHLEPQCRRCRGQLSIQVAEKVIDCPSCKDHRGVHRYGNRERAAYVRRPMREVERAGKKIDRVAKVLSAYDRAVNVDMNIRLRLVS